MKTNEVLLRMEEKEFLEKLYQFSYHRCSISYEAEDLCSDIILAVLSAVYKQEEVVNFYGFVWAIAHRVYADFCAKRKRRGQVSIEYLEEKKGVWESEKNEIESLINEMEDADELKNIFREIAFLSKAYRETMVMYYIDGMKVQDIARSLAIGESTVKQRLFSARNIVRKEMEDMDNRNLSLKPIKLAYLGTGEPEGNDPRIKAERTFSKNLVYLCKDKPKTIRELSEELCIPMLYVEEELEIQCYGQNGKYGMLRRLNNGKYAANILILDYGEYREAAKVYEKHISEFCAALKEGLRKNKDKILAFPYLCPSKDIQFILWAMISRIFWNFDDSISKAMSKRFFEDIIPARRDFTCAAVAYRDGEDPEWDFYGYNGASALETGGYKSVFVSSMNGRHVKGAVFCGHNISQDAGLLMALRAIGGLDTELLTEQEKEIAAKAAACGYLCRESKENRSRFVPGMIVIDSKNAKDFYGLSYSISENMKEIADVVAEELAVFIKKHIPDYLRNEYLSYQMMAGSAILSKVIDSCIKEGMLSDPEMGTGAEGMLMVVKIL